jgi:hypothetical protein
MKTPEEVIQKLRRKRTPKSTLRDTGEGWRREFLYREEAIALRRWLTKHLRECKGPGDMIIATSTSSGIGRNFVVRCNHCDACEDITDYFSW